MSGNPDLSFFALQRKEVHDRNKMVQINFIERVSKKIKGEKK